jgi:hypothetical protein
MHCRSGDPCFFVGSVIAVLHNWDSYAQVSENSHAWTPFSPTGMLEGTVFERTEELSQPPANKFAGL